MASRAVFADLEALDWEGWPPEQHDQRGRARWKTLFTSERDGTAGIAAGLGSIAPGEELSEHSHPQHEVYFVTAGTATLTVDGDRHEIPAGGAIFIHGGARHCCRNERDEELRFIFCFPADSVGDVAYDF